MGCQLDGLTSVIYLLQARLLNAQPPQEQKNCRRLIKVRFHTMLILRNILFLGLQTPSHRSLFTMYPNLYINLAYLFSMAAHLSENERGFTLGLVKVDVSQTNQHRLSLFNMKGNQLKNGKTAKQRLLNFGPFWDQKGQQDEITVQLQLYACFFSSISCASKVCRQLRIFKEFELILNASKKVQKY